MTDEVMLHKASQTRLIVIVLSVIALLVGIIIAWTIYRGICGPLEKGISLAQTIASKDLTQSIDIDQNDEIGILAKALNQMTEDLNIVLTQIDQATKTGRIQFGRIIRILPKFSERGDRAGGEFGRDIRVHRTIDIID